MINQFELFQLSDKGITGATIKAVEQDSLTLFNPPGQTKLIYRVGTYSTFLEQMLSQIRQQTIDSTGASYGNRPLQAFNIDGDHKFGIALLQAWAVVGDILSFYQERILNEGYLLSATEALSIYELVHTIGYRPKPALAATTYLAFTLLDTPGVASQYVKIPKGPATVIQSLPKPGTRPVTFETRKTIIARPIWNCLKPHISTQVVIPEVGPSTTELRLQGVVPGIKVGTPLLLRSTESTDWLFAQLKRVQPYRTHGYTLISWQKRPPSLPSPPTLKQFSAFALQRKAHLFGYNALSWKTAPVLIKQQVGTYKGGLYFLSPRRREWFPRNSGLPTNSPIQALAVSANGVLFAGTTTGPYKSVDGGHTWQHLNRGLIHQNVHAISISDDGQIYLGMAGGAVYRSVDQGNTWDSLQGSLSIHPVSNSFETVNTRLPKTVVRSLAVYYNSKINTTIVIAGTDNGVFFYYESSNAWQPSNKGLPGFNPTTQQATVSVQALFVDTAKRILYAGTKQGLYCLALPDRQASHKKQASIETSGIFRRENARKPYQIWLSALEIVDQLNFLLRKRYTPIAARYLPETPIEAKQIVWQPLEVLAPSRLPSSDNIARNQQAGSIRSPLLSVFAIVSIGDLALPSSKLFIGTNVGVFRLQKNGKRWQLFNKGLPKPDQHAPGTSFAAPVRALVTVHEHPTSSSYLLAATSKGIFQLNHPDNTWKALNRELLPLFSIDLELKKKLNDTSKAKPVTEPIRKAFEDKGIFLADQATVAHVDQDSDIFKLNIWQIIDPLNAHKYWITQAQNCLKISRQIPLTNLNIHVLAANQSGIVIAAAPFIGFLESEWPNFHLRNNCIDLDKIYGGIMPGDTMLISQNLPQPLEELFEVKAVASVSRTDFAKSATITRLYVHPSPLLPRFNLRQAKVYFQVKMLPLFTPKVSKFEPIEGRSLRIQGIIPDLKIGQSVSLTGKRIAVRFVASGGLFNITHPHNLSIEFPSQSIQALVVDAQGALVVGTSSGVFRNVGLEQWQPLEKISQNIKKDVIIRVLAIDPQGTLVAGTSSGAFRYVEPTSGKATWEPVGPRLDVWSFTIFNAHLIAGTNNGVYSFHDNLSKWALMGNFNRAVVVKSLVFNPESHLYAGTNEGVFYYDKLSKIWQACNQGLANLDVRAMALDLNNRLYAGTAGGGVYKFINNRDIWQPKNFGLTNQYIQTILVTKNNQLYVGTRGDGIFFTTNSGCSWSPLPLGISNNILTLLGSHSNEVYAGASTTTILKPENSFDQAYLTHTYLFSLPYTYQNELNQGNITQSIHDRFLDQGYLLGTKASVSTLKLSDGHNWLIRDEGSHDFIIYKRQDQLAVFHSLSFEIIAAPLRLNNNYSKLNKLSIKTSTGMIGSLVVRTEEVIYEQSLSTFPEVGEIILLSQESAIDIEHNVTTLLLAQDLQFCYDPNTLSINANTVAAIEGETIENEILGSGNSAIKNQKFILKNAPLSFHQSDKASEYVSTLKIRVDADSHFLPSLTNPRLNTENQSSIVQSSIPWKEKSTLSYSKPTSQDYTLQLNKDHQTVVIFGNGIQGARLPSGNENIKATYRYRSATNGNVEAGCLSILKKKPAEVRKVTNPVPAIGGTNPESHTSARQIAPLTVQNLDRIVTLNDYKTFIDTYPGIGKTLVQFLSLSNQSRIQITIATHDSQPVAPDSPLIKQLWYDIRQLQAIIQPVDIATYEILYFQVSAILVMDPQFTGDYQKQLLQTVHQTLIKHFSFAKRDFGQSVTHTEIISIIQGIAGIQAVELISLHMVGTSPQVVNSLPAHLARWDNTLEQLLPAQLLLISRNPVDGIVLN